MPAPVHAFAPFAKALEPLMADAFPDRESICWAREEEFTRGLPDVEFMLTLFAPRGQWIRAERMRLIQCMGAGVDDVLGEPLPPGVLVANNRGAAAPTMSEFGLALVLALLKQLPLAWQIQGQRGFDRFVPEPVAGKTLGILGAGAIGLALAEKAAALGMRVIGTQRSPKPHPALAKTLGTEETDAVLAESDVLVVLLPLTEETRGLLSADRVALMKPGAHLVNLARGGIVDEAAVRAALEAGRLASAAFDVFAAEPLPPDDPFRDAPNLLITPHVGGGYPDYLPQVVARYAENVARVERGEAPQPQVDLSQGY